MEGLKHSRIKILLLFILSEIVLIELIVFCLFGNGYTSSEIFGMSEGEYMVIVFKKDYFLGRVEVCVKPDENSTVTLIFPSGEALNITNEYVFDEALLPGSIRGPFAGVPFTSEYNYSMLFLLEEPVAPYYIYLSRKEELGRFLPLKVSETMMPFYLVTVIGKSFTIEVNVYGVVPWNRS